MQAVSTFDLIINAVNDDPQMVSIPNQEAQEDEGIILVELNATDVDGDECIIFIPSSDEIEVSMDGSTLNISPDENQIGNFEISIYCEDENGGTSESTSFELTINNVNDIPQLGDIDDYSISEDPLDDEIIVLSINPTAPDL